MSSFQIVALEYRDFAHLFQLPDAQLQALGVIRTVATADSGFPCRVSLQDAARGDELLLLPYEHQAVASPYRASGPIFVRRDAVAATLPADELPPCVIGRLISLRAYDHADMMVAASVVDGAELGTSIEQQFSDPAIAYIHLHNAKPGCFSCKAVRSQGRG